MSKQYQAVHDAETLNTLFERVRAAQRAFASFSPVLAMYKAKDFEDAVSKAERLVFDGGMGHTAPIYINHSNLIRTHNRPQPVRNNDYGFALY